ncbi:MAG TPA: tyrosine-type recombinase/integrase [Terriglobia bacterium]|nr:tyrosine-type recombinase/integrase [Terriglobia bacterium]
MKQTIDDWLAATRITTGRMSRCGCRAGKAWGDGMTERVVWHVVKQYAAKLGLARIAPHDLRRSCVRLCHVAGGEMEQIQFLLGHVSVQTTEKYLGSQQRLHGAVNGCPWRRFPVNVELCPYGECRHCQSRSKYLSAIRLGVTGNLHAGGIVLGESSMAADYIVDEVRRVREEQAAKHDFDVKLILAAAKKRQRRSGRTVVSLVQKKALGAALKAD